MKTNLQNISNRWFAGFFAALLGLCFAKAQGQTVTFVNNAGSAGWSQSSNWSPAGSPNGFDVLIDGFATTVNQSFSIGNLTLSDGAVVNIPNGGALNVTGDLTDNGAIIVNSDQANTVVMSFTGGTVSGTGTIILNCWDNNARLNGTLTQASSHTISGMGQINAALTNNGTVNANSGGGYSIWVNGPTTNNNLMEATNGSVLEITNGATITQGVSGQLLANGGNVRFDNGTTISGGSLNSSTNSSVFVVHGPTTFESLTNNAAVNIPNGGALNVTGDLIDNGTIVVNSDQAGTEVMSLAGGTVSGTGTIILNCWDNNAQLNGTLTQGAGHMISGMGQINATLTNNGTVNANSANSNGRTLRINGPTTNNGLMQASNGCVLSFASGALTNLSGNTLTGGTFEADTNSTINLPGSVVTNAASVILNGPGSSFGAINSLASNSGLFEVVGGQSFITAGDLANSGTMIAGVNSLVAVNGALSQTATGTLAGSGSFTAASFTLAGAVSPGIDSPGTLTLVGNTALNLMTTLNFDLGSPTGANNHLSVVGNFILGGTLNIGALPGFGAGVYDLIDYGGGTFTDGILGIGSAPDGYSYEVTTSTPGQVDLTVTAVPEPSTWALVVGGAGVLLLHRRRR